MASPVSSRHEVSASVAPSAEFDDSIGAYTFRSVSNRRAASGSSGGSIAVLEKPNAQIAVTSAGIYSRRCDPLAIRRKFPERWMGFLRAHFSGPVEVAYVFSVDPKTARHWWEGSYGPQGWAVEFAHRAVPGARTFLEAV